ncbi:TIGR02281 family clan AA aspartic protease [Pseudomonadota bacterium]
MSEHSGNADSRLGKRMLWVAALGLLGGLYLLFSSLENRAVTTTSVASNGAVTVMLVQDRNGHYTADGQINGRPVTFLVDTGATDVALPESVARAMGLEFGPRVKVMTARFSSDENNRYKPPNKPSAATHSIRFPRRESALPLCSDIKLYQSQIHFLKFFQTS